ncbi:MAG: tetratricopeptide repeat protein, partial [Myxococcota bacterium]
GSGPAGRRAEVRARRGDAAFAEGILVEALRDWADALAELDAAAEPRRTAELRRKMGAAAWAAGEKRTSLEHLERGLEALDGDLDNLEAARLHDELARIHFRLGDTARATESSTRALELGERLGAADVIASSCNALGGALARAGELERGIEQVLRALATALDHGLGSAACRAYANLAVMYTTLDHLRSRDYCRDGLALAQRIGDQLHQSWLHCALAGGHCTLAGDYDEGVRAAETAAEIDRRLGQRSHLPIPLILLGQILQCRGEYDRSERHYREALAVADETGEPQFLCPCYEGLATLAVERGDESEAEEWLERSRALREAAGWSRDTFLVLPFLC